MPQWPPRCRPVWPAGLQASGARHAAAHPGHVQVQRLHQSCHTLLAGGPFLGADCLCAMRALCLRTNSWLMTIPASDEHSLLIDNDIIKDDQSRDLAVLRFVRICTAAADAGLLDEAA